MQTHAIPGFYEPFSALTHLIGATAFAVYGVALLRRARGDRGRVAFLAVYVVSSVVLLATSGVFHTLPDGSTARAVLGRLDFAAIFMLIAGTHTPIQGLFFRGIARWLPLALMWSAVVVGSVFFSVYYHELPRGLGTGVFLTLGWIAGGSGLILWRRLGTRSLGLLIGGGVAYSVGAVCMGRDWPTLVPGVIGPHELWHVAVLSAMWMHWHFFYSYAAGEPVRPSSASRAGQAAPEVGRAGHPLRD